MTLKRACDGEVARTSRPARRAKARERQSVVACLRGAKPARTQRTVSHGRPGGVCGVIHWRAVQQTAAGGRELHSVAAERFPARRTARSVQTNTVASCTAVSAGTSTLAEPPRGASGTPATAQGALACWRSCTASRPSATRRPASTSHRTAWLQATRARLPTACSRQPLGCAHVTRHASEAAAQ